jgi:hypothetical protein
VKSQHLSDEAIAAFADGVLVSHARTRAARHTAECPECAYAVAIQREAIWAMRAAPAPALPTGLLDRLRDVPAHTPIQGPPDAMAPDGSGVFAAFGTPAAALAPPTRGQAQLGPDRTPGRSESRGHVVTPIIATVAAVAAAGALAVGSAAHAVAGKTNPQSHRPGTARQVSDVQDGPALFAPASWPGRAGR